MLTFYILNVGHGSSIVVEYENDDGRFFGVIDSNTTAGTSCRALTKLKERGAKRLSFLSLTHPHKDHFSGLYDIILAFPHGIDHFYSCPFGDLLSNKTRFRQLALKLKALQERTDSREHRRAAHEFLQLLCWADTGAKSGELSWFECSGDFLSIAPPGFSGIEIATILPPNKAKGNYVQQIERQDRSILGGVEENEISLALQFTFSGVTIVLGGDGTRNNWESRRRFESNKNISIKGQVVNLPHHGSKYDCDDGVISQLFSNTGDRFAITSANGLTHPDLDVIKFLEQNQIRPYCTNLIPACGANAQRLLLLPCEPNLARWLREVAENQGQVQVCQGDVTVRVSRDGNFDVIPQHANACDFRGDYRSLFA
jgi:beta-lactamase superfamily II metal-dependent hydrolase